MKTRLFLTLSLFAVLLAAACASATPVAPAQPDGPVIVESGATPLVDIPSATLEAISTETIAPPTPPIATSRGPELHATDPTTVSLAAGQLQFVEFFRFT